MENPLSGPIHRMFDENDRLNVELKRLRSALESIAGLDHSADIERAIEIARKFMKS